MKSKLKAIDLFSGAGGLSKGFTMANYEILLAIDNDKNASQTYKINHKDTIFLEKDINNINSNEILEILYNKQVKELDCIIGGPPCQGYSSVGKRILEDERNFLYKNFVRIVSDLKPKTFVMENVEGLLTIRKNQIKKETMTLIKKGIITEDIIYELENDMIPKKIIESIKNIGINKETIEKLKESRVAMQIKEDFENIGYSVEYKILNAANYGVPQLRKRVFFIGIRKDIKISPSFPKATHEEAQYTTIGDVINDLPNNITNRYKYKPQSLYQALMRNLISPEDFYRKSIDLDLLENNHDILSEHEVKFLSNEQIQKMIEHKNRHIEKKTGFGMRFFNYNKVGYTLTTHFQSNYEMLHPDTEHPRYFTIREGARIQGFPDNYIFYGGKQSKAKQIGNSVPVLLSYSIAQNLRNNILDTL